MLLEDILKEINLAIIEVNENLPLFRTNTRIQFLVLARLYLKFFHDKIKYIMAWPGKVEISYFDFTVCWNPFRAFGTSNTDFILHKSGIIQ